MNRDTRALQKRGYQILKRGGIESAAFDAWRLLEHICSVSRTDVIVNPLSAKVGKEDEDAFISACQRRADGEPLQYILGKWEFMGLEFEVNPSVLIPRADTETLVEYILSKYSGAPRILDMCCGSGCIGLSVKHFLPECDMTLADISKDALNAAQKNARMLGLDVKIMQADAKLGFEEYFSENTFDIIVSNPPYIKSKDMQKLSREVLREPHIALDGGEDGMDFYRALVTGWEPALKKGGEMILEAGFDTAKSIYSLFAECGYSDIVKRRDLGAITRLVAAKRGLWE